MKISENIKRIAFRLEANERIGIGHLMRCLTIIRELKKVGIESTIYAVSAIDKALMEGNAHFIKMDTVAFSEEDARILKKYMDKRKECVLFIDSYEVTPQYVQSLKKYSRIIMADSFCDYQVEMVIQPNAFLSQMQEQEGNAEVYLKGLSYQPVRHEFFENHLEIKREVNHILILSGGTFPKQFCEGLLEELYMWNKAANVSIVLGNYVSDDIDRELHERFDRCKLQIHRNVSNMSEIMCENDVVISACGSTIFEIMACGAPVIAYSMADNQRYALERLQKDAGILYAGDITENGIFKKILTYLEELKEVDLRKKQVYSMKKMISCNGAENIVRKIIEYFG